MSCRKTTFGRCHVGCVSAWRRSRQSLIWSASSTSITSTPRSAERSLFALRVNATLHSTVANRGSGRRGSSTPVCLDGDGERHSVRRTDTPRRDPGGSAATWVDPRSRRPKSGVSTFSPAEVDTLIDEARADRFAHENHGDDHEDLSRVSRRTVIRTSAPYGPRRVVRCPYPSRSGASRL